MWLLKCIMLELDFSDLSNFVDWGLHLVSLYFASMPYCTLYDRWWLCEWSLGGPCQHKQPSQVMVIKIDIIWSPLICQVFWTRHCLTCLLSCVGACDTWADVRFGYTDMHELWVPVGEYEPNCVSQRFHTAAYRCAGVWTTNYYASFNTSCRNVHISIYLLCT